MKRCGAELLESDIQPSCNSVELRIRGVSEAKHREAHGPQNSRRQRPPQQEPPKAKHCLRYLAVTCRTRNKNDQALVNQLSPRKIVHCLKPGPKASSRCSASEQRRNLKSGECLSSIQNSERDNLRRARRARRPRRPIRRGGRHCSTPNKSIAGESCLSREGPTVTVRVFTKFKK